MKFYYLRTWIMALDWKTEKCVLAVKARPNYLPYFS